ncbi:Ribokinase-like protein [Phakopsora pachyrhizi]|nr:Ribokinase-like protein [Phakopsora pachyrhizi]
MSVDHLLSCINGLELNGLLNHDALLTGFTPGAGAMEALKLTFKKLKSRNPDLVYLVDPVMGDDGKLYVSQDVIPKYKDLLSLATIATPNQFEAQILTGIDPKSISDIKKCLLSFHNKFGIAHVVVTSISIPTSELRSYKDLPHPDSEGNVLLCAGSTMSPTETSLWGILFPKREEKYAGVGDLFASVLLGRFRSSESKYSLREAAELALATTQGILDTTNEFVTAGGSGSTIPLSRAQSSELKIIQGRRFIENPIVKYRAIDLF